MKFKDSVLILFNHIFLMISHVVDFLFYLENLNSLTD